MSGPRRAEPLLPNALIVARREYLDRVRSRVFHVSTLILASLAIFVSLIPIVALAVDRASVSRVAVVAGEAVLGDRSVAILDGLMNVNATGGASRKGYEFVRLDDPAAAIAAVADGRVAAALVVDREPGGRVTFEFHAGRGIGDDRLQLLSVGAFGIAVLDYSETNPISGFEMPDIQLLRPGPDAGSPSVPFDSAAFAGRTVLGLVLVFLLFISIVIYGMWVAAGVVAEKSSRVMELLVGAASARQLVAGKVLGIGAAGASQCLVVLLPAVAVLVVEDRIAGALLGPGASVAPALGTLSPGLLVAFAAFYVLGFTLYALVYAAACSLLSRPEDLQVVALPLSLIALAGYGPAILAVSGAMPTVVRLASYVPFWSPFVMLSRLSVGRVEPWELLLAVGLLVGSIAIVGVIAVRIYAAGVLLYGQRPGLRAYVAAVRGG